MIGSLYSKNKQNCRNMTKGKVQLVNQTRNKITNKNTAHKIID